jgi:hypothetical protein
MLARVPRHPSPAPAAAVVALRSAGRAGLHRRLGRPYAAMLARVTPGTPPLHIAGSPPLCAGGAAVEKARPPHLSRARR